MTERPEFRPPNAHEPWRLEQQGTEPRRGRALSGPYAPLYAVLAVLALVLSFFPLFNDVVEHDDGVTLTRHFGSLYEMAARPGGQPALIGLTLMIALIVLLVVAAFRKEIHPGLPASITGVAAVIALMLLAKPGTGDPVPSLTHAGTADVAIAIATVALTSVHAYQLFSRRQRHPPA